MNWLKKYIRKVVAEMMIETPVSVKGYRILKIASAKHGTCWYRLEQLDKWGYWESIADTIWTSDNGKEKNWSEMLNIPIPTRINQVI